MNEPVAVHGILVGHGTMPDGMVDAVRQITGSDPDALTPLSNRGMSPDALTDAVQRLVGSGPAIVFTDLQSGSCSFVARRLAVDREDIVVVSGVNLPLLLEFVMNRTKPLAELVPRLLKVGRATIGCAPPSLEDHEHRAVSGR